MPTSRQEILVFMRRHRIAVQASVADWTSPQAAAVGVIVTDEFEVFFDTLDTSRKVTNLRGNARVAFVIGGLIDGEEQSVQYEGVVDEPTGPELEALKEQYFARCADGSSRQSWPGITYLRAKPRWLRFSDFTQTPQEIVELDFSRDLPDASMTPVGLTARWIAASRALETESAVPLFNDPLARALSGDAGFAMMAAMRVSMGADAKGPEPYLSIRTKFLDDAILAATREGPIPITQVVIFAAGMDARAFRLDWPAGLTLFEIDRDHVFDHKEPILTRLGARALCERRVVRADLAQPWTEALLAARFDPSRPAAFLTEGLVMYLEEQVALDFFATLGSLARDGSWLGMDIVNRDVLTSPYMARYLKRLADFGCAWKFGPPDPAEFLAGQGWQGVVVQPGDAEANYGRWPFPPMPRGVPNIPRTFLVSARRVASQA